MPVAKVRVKRAELIKVVEGRLRKLEKEHERQKLAYPAKLEAWQNQQADRLERIAADMRRGKTPNMSRIALDNQPLKPDGYRERCQLERTLKTLKIGSEEAILLSPDDADHYFGPCQTRKD